MSPTNPALNAGNPAVSDGIGNHCVAADQRNMPRPQGGRCDIGAYEYPTSNGSASKVYFIKGINQNTVPGRAFPEPLSAFVSDVQGNPLSGATVTFTAPESGPSGIFTNTNLPTTTATTNSNGIATASAFTANNQHGAFTVAASAAGATTNGTYSLNTGLWYVSPTGSDSNNCKTKVTTCVTVNGVLGKNPTDNNIILVQNGVYTGSGDFVITINKDVMLSGGWNTDFSSQIGYTTIDGQFSRRDIFVDNSTVLIERFEIINGYAESSFGSGIYNIGLLTIRSSLIYDNFTDFFGGGVYSENLLVVDDVYIFNNFAEKYGGGIASVDGDLTIVNSAIYNNKSENTSNTGYGGGVYISAGIGESATAAIANTNISKNYAQNGGGIFKSGNVTFRLTIAQSLKIGWVW